MTKGRQTESRYNYDHAVLFKLKLLWIRLKDNTFQRETNGDNGCWAVLYNVEQFRFVFDSCPSTVFHNVP